MRTRDHYVRLFSICHCVLRRKIGCLFVALLFAAPLAVSAQNKVVVIPLFGDRTDSTPPAFIPLAAENPANSEYETGTGTVVDNITGLEWQTSSLPGLKNWTDATTYCGGLFHDEKSNWRLPDIQELLSIVKYDSAPLAINVATFLGTHSAGYWSATSEAGSGNRAWFVNFGGGAVKSAFKTNPYYVRCVR